ncbi:hypothetical protein OG562_33790 [Streptomyces sp. NBC_01275]|uniref:WXG100 family type VII secretion target n=1 Tax=Streptomyces sp. NBC_01275 TaxID=2903807 RepID=UPI00225C3504|nr:WXG100 family type VII secretion target [Streptomyces sp. NBC_01275]MCX4765865.1 hypothetical protein [Streptomyces sp. NBC_01275]
MAFTSVQTRRQDLENTKLNLAKGHQGSDGKAYQELLALWDEQAEVISRNLRDMIDTLNETLKQQGIAQGSANDSVNQAYNQSQSVFDALSG